MSESTETAPIKSCACKHPFQDSRYGVGQRVHTVHGKTTGKGASASFECTVCGTKKNGFTLVELIIAIAIIGILAAIVLPLLGAGSGIGYSDGDRLGTVQKFSYKGLFCKTWEGEAAMQGWHPTYSTDSDGNTRQTGMSNIFEFTVKDPAVISQVQAAMASGRIVDLHYDQRVLYSPCRSSSGYFITSVRDPGALAAPAGPSPVVPQ